MQEVHVQYILLKNVSSPKVSGTCSWNGTESTDGTSTFYCTVYTTFIAALRKCRTFVHYYCSVEVLIKKIDPAYFAFLVKFTAHFACRIAYFFSLPIL